MNSKKRGLGKGLADLGLSTLLTDLKSHEVPIIPTAVIEEKNMSEDMVDGQLKKISIHAVVPGKYQPRKIMATDALEELANSIRTQGVIQPIVVRLIASNQYEIIAGERRWRAAQLAGLSFIPAILRNISDETAMILAVIENIQRRDLNVMEEAVALNRLMHEFHMTHEAIADAVGKKRATITNILRLLKLPDAVRELVENGKLDMGHARALLMLDAHQQFSAAEIIVARTLSVRETEDLVRKMMSVPSSSASSSSEQTILHSLQDRLSQKLNVKVSISQNAKGRGKIVIHYKNEKELENILTHIN